MGTLVMLLVLWGHVFGASALDAFLHYQSHVPVQYFDYPEEIHCSPTGLRVRIRNDSFQGMSIRLSILDNSGVPRDLRSLRNCRFRTIPETNGSLLFLTPYDGCFVHEVNNTVSMELRIDGIDESKRIIVIERIPVNCSRSSQIVPVTSLATPVFGKPTMTVTPRVVTGVVKPVNVTAHPGAVTPIVVVKQSSDATPVATKPAKAIITTPVVKPSRVTTPSAVTPMVVKPANVTTLITPAVTPASIATPASVTPLVVRPAGGTTAGMVTPLVKPSSATRPSAIPPVMLFNVTSPAGVTPMVVKPANGTTPRGVVTPVEKPANVTIPGAVTPMVVKPPRATAPGEVTPAVKPPHVTTPASVTPVVVRPADVTTPGGVVTPLVKPDNVTTAGVVTPVLKPTNATTPRIITPVVVKPANVTTPGVVTPIAKPTNVTTAGVTPMVMKPTNVTALRVSTPVVMKPAPATTRSVTPDAKPADVTTPGVVTPMVVKPATVTTPRGVTSVVRPADLTTPRVITPMDMKPANTAIPGVTPVVKPASITTSRVITPDVMKPADVTTRRVVTPMVVKPATVATPRGVTPAVKPASIATPEVKPTNVTAPRVVTPVVMKPANATTPGVITPVVKPASATPSGQIINGGKPTVCAVDAKDRLPCSDIPLDEQACYAKGCCYDPDDEATACFYGKTAYIDCANGGLFTIVVPKVATVPSLDLASVVLVNGTSSECAPVMRTTEFVIFSFPLNACGSVQTVTGSILTYEVDVVARRRIQKGARGSITRDSIFRLHVKCYLSSSENVPITLRVNTLSPPSLVIYDGVLHLEMRIAKELSYTTWFADEDYPIVSYLREPVYVEVRLLHRQDANIALVLNHCWATQTQDRHFGKQWSILVNGCPYHGDNYLTRLHSVVPTPEVLFPAHHKWFEVKTFQFVDGNTRALLSGEVYLHCSATVCPLSDVECVSTCPTGKRTVRSSGDFVSIEAHDQRLVTLKKSIIFSPEEKTAAVSYQANENVAANILLAAAVISLALALITGLVLCWNCKQMHKS